MKKAPANTGLNIFESAAKASDKKVKKSQKPEVIIDTKFEKKFKRFSELKAEIETKEAEFEMIASEIKDEAKVKYVEEYKKQQKRPDNFNLVAGKEKLLYMVQDKYIKVDDEKAGFLQQQFPAALTKTTTYSLNKDVLDRNPSILNILNNVILKAAGISDEDKAALFIANTERVVTKGTIEKLMVIGKDKWETLLETVQPVCMLKNVTA